MWHRKWLSPGKREIGISVNNCSKSIRARITWFYEELEKVLGDAPAYVSCEGDVSDTADEEGEAFLMMIEVFLSSPWFLLLHFISYLANNEKQLHLLNHVFVCQRERERVREMDGWRVTGEECSHAGSYAVGHHADPVRSQLDRLCSSGVNNYLLVVQEMWIWLISIWQMY